MERDSEGLIPAHAGKTFLLCAYRRFAPAHPRSRGENALDFSPNHTLGGSSPLTRGKPRAAGRTRPRSRLIPAHAGKTMPLSRRARTRRAHPRSRGENHLPGLVDAYDGGSSPLTRGKRHLAGHDAASFGLIPAHAGKTVSCLRGRRPQRAHPRSRGENMVRLGAYADALGSSPLTRGKRLLNTERARDARLIPAHAGKTSG